MIQNITSRLYSDIPGERLYHYSSFNGLLGIVESRSLWASDIRYMNDSAELKHTADLIRKEVTRRIRAGHQQPDLLNQFLDWVTHRITNGHMLFATSFRSNGNLLSQCVNIPFLVPTTFREKSHSCPGFSSYCGSPAGGILPQSPLVGQALPYELVKTASAAKHP